MSTFIWTGASSAVWSTAGNWTPAGPPANGDDVIFDGTAVGPVAGSDQSAVTLNSLTIKATFGSAAPGTIYFGTNGTPLKIKVTTGNAVRIGDASDSPAAANGTQRINLDLSTSVPVVTVVSSNSTSLDTGKEVVRLRLNSASADVNVLGGSVGIATDNATDTATVANVNVSGGTCNLGSGVTYTNLNNNGGIVKVRSAPATAIVNGAGDVYSYGAYLIPTVTLQGNGTFYAQHRAASGDSLTTLNIRQGGTFDTSQSGEAITVHALVYRRGRIRAFSPSQITFTTTTLDLDDASKFSAQNA